VFATDTDVQRSPHFGTVLLVDDSPDDVFLVGRAFRQVGIPNPLVVVGDGDQAIQYLKGEGIYADREQFPIPVLVLLDLNTPRVTGFEVLTWLRQDPDFRHLPVIVLTASTYSPDVTRAYQLGANSFLTKPTDFLRGCSSLSNV
jgi:CheY-like chemotaxis protein